MFVEQRLYTRAHQYREFLKIYERGARPRHNNLGQPV
jgi:hypothetical protein